MARDHLLVIDQGTTSTRAVLYNARLQPAGQGQIEVLPSYPRSGWVEQPHADALIASVGSQCVNAALRDAGVKADRIAAIGLTNQREYDDCSGAGDGPADRGGLGLAGPQDGRHLRRLHSQRHWITPQYRLGP